MKVAVCIKQTFDTEAVIRLAGPEKIDKTGIKLILNPYDEYAVEQALLIKEKNGAEVIVFSTGEEETKEAIRQALAMGADRAVLVQDTNLKGSDHHGTALALARAIQQEQCDLILAGWVAIDDGTAQVPARIAEILNIPQVNVVTKMSLEGNKAVCQREGDGVAHIMEVSLPAVITAQKGLNEPRYPALKGIMQAKKKPIKVMDLAALGIKADQVEAKVKSVGFTLPASRKAGRIIEGEADQAACQLVSLIHEEAKVV